MEGLQADPPAPPVPDRPEAVAEEVLRTVRTLIAELRPGSRVEARLDSSLERDLGLDSLARAELLLRLERTLGRGFPERALSQAETPRDLVRLALSGEGRAALAAEVEALALGEAEAPAGAKHLLEVLLWHASRHPDRLHIRFEGEGGDLTYGGLLRRAGEVAAGLVRGGLPAGDAVGLMLPTGEDYFLAFTGVLLAGGIPVPIYPPFRPSQIEEHVRRHAGILANAEARLLLTVPEAKPVGRLLAALAPTVRRVATVADLRMPGGTCPPPDLMPGHTAFLQYTSGSTGAPKGVVVSHANVLANLRAMGRVAGLRPTDVLVSWLPLYHDMGLIGAWLSSLYFAFPLALMSPAAFLARPARWLWALHRHRATLTAAPNFAYDLCLRKVDGAELEGLDLSSLRYACNGAEPVLPDTVAAFESRFARWGLRPGALAPVYGLAEATLDLTMPPPGRGLLIDRIQRRAFVMARRAEPADPGDDAALRFTGCGFPLPGHQMRVVDANGREVGDREEGRLQFKGPSATSGYFRNPEETAALFQEGWLDTGDYAYLASGELFLTGRAKDLIIRGGRNLYPYELEEAIGNVPGVRRGCVAVFGVPDPLLGTERLVVAAETRETVPAARSAIQTRIGALAVELLGDPPEEVILLPPRTVLKTSSGKIRRSACRDLYLQGRMGRRGPAPAWQISQLILAGARNRGRDLAGRARQLLHGLRGWLAFTLIFPPLALGAAALPARGWVLAHRLARFFLRLAGIPLRIEGLERIPEGPCVAVVNHASYLDSMLILAAFARPFAIVAKTELARSPLGFLLRRLGAIFIERFDPARGLEDATRMEGLLKEGRPLLWFPEGTFQRAAGLLPFRLGAFQAAVRCGVPILPVVLRGSRSVLRDGTWLPRRGGVRMEILPPLRPEGEGWAEAVRLRNAARQEMLARCGEPDLGEEPSPLFL